MKVKTCRHANVLKDAFHNSLHVCISTNVILFRHSVIRP